MQEIRGEPAGNGLLKLFLKLVTSVTSSSLCVSNIAALVTNEGHSLLFHGGAVKSQNQFFNKRKAELTSIMTKGHEDTKGVTSHQLRSLSRYRDGFIRDQFHKISAQVVAFCLEHKVGILVLGNNQGWKQEVNMGKHNNQEFVSIPHAVLRFMITYKAERAGITVINQEESYTSKASCPDMDPIPVYGEEGAGSVKFSGRRTSRGLYRTKDGLLLNADCNGAANILRKAFPDAFKSCKDFSFLNEPLVYGFHDLNPKRNLVKQIDVA